MNERFERMKQIMQVQSESESQLFQRVNSIDATVNLEYKALVLLTQEIAGYMSVRNALERLQESCVRDDAW